MFSGCGRSAQEQAQTQAQNTTPNLPSSLPPRFRFQNYFGKRNTNETGFVFILMSGAGIAPNKNYLPNLYLFI